MQVEIRSTSRSPPPANLPKQAQSTQKHGRNVHHALYNEARVKSAMHAGRGQQKDRESKSPKFTRSTLNEKSKQHFINKFTKQIITVWQECPDHILDAVNRENETMNQNVMRYILRQLGFIVDIHEKHAKSKSRERERSPFSSRKNTALPEKQGFVSDALRENINNKMISMFNLTAILEMDRQEKKINALWRQLGGYYYGHVTLNNLRMFLLAIKGLHVIPEVKIDFDQATFISLNQVESHSELNQDLSRSQEPFQYLGQFSKQGDLYMYEEDVSKSIHMFKDLAQNRLMHEQNKLVEKKSEHSNT